MLTRLAAMLTVAAALVWGCSSFGSSHSPAAAVDGGLESATGEPPDLDGGDTVAPDSSSAPSCSVPRADSTSDCSRMPNACTAETVVDPIGAGIPLATYPFGIAVDDRWLFWAAMEDPNGGGNGYILRAPKAGGPPEQLTDPLPGLGPIAVSSDAVLFRATLDAGATAVLAVPKTASCTGGCQKPVLVLTSVSGDPISGFALTKDQRRVVAHENFKLAETELADAGWTDRGVVGMSWNGIVAADDVVFQLTGDDPVVRQIDFTTHDAGSYFVGPGNGSQLAVRCGERFAVFQNDAGALVTLDISDPTKPRPIGNAPGAYQIDFDAQFLYFAVPNANGVFRLPRDGSQTNAVLIAPGNVFSLAVDDAYVYFGEHGGSGVIKRIAK
jgi:hypothetical protein